MADEIRLHEYVVLSNTSDPPSVIARLWWDGERVQCEPPDYLDALEDRTMMARIEIRDGRPVLVGASPKDGVAFLEMLPMRFRNGYQSCRRVR